MNANSSVWESKTFKKSDQLALNLDTHGRLYLSDVVTLKNFTNGEESFGNTKSSVLYRAKLDSDGSFGLYKDTIGSESEETLVIWNTSSEKLLDDMKMGRAICEEKFKGLGLVCIACVTLGLILIFLRKYDIIFTRAREVAVYAREVVAYNSDKS
ncbi:hypothetical protein FRX31_027649 [Thalictrum thalictroides]|uniref:Uncharacterized protein n=1 Tax=Thalictrum thalictroides TaxID=46969 RepID=A0A7J6VCY6_THATH|nr:hypothetical protein FRX31_027649 [Thalictrum thalictroides]